MSNFRQNKCTDFITIILLCYNRKEYSQLALTAILNQSHQAVKIIVVDNHSTDGSEEILPKFIKDDPRAIYLRLGKNSNAANSYLTGIALAQTEFVLVTHDDDILDLDYVSKIVQVLKKDQDIGMVACNARLINSEGNVTNPKLYNLRDNLLFNLDEYIIYYCKNKLWLPTSSLCFRKRLHQEIYVKTRYPKTTHIRDIGKDCLPPDRYKPSGDIEFCARLNRKQKIYFISDPKISYRQHIKQESRTVNQWEPMLNAAKSLRRVYKNNSDIFQALDLLFVKFSMQKFLMNGDLSRLREFLKRHPQEKFNEFAAIGRSLYLNEATSLENFEFTDRNYKLLASNVTKATPFINSENIQKKIILVGSMLMSFFIYERLKKDSWDEIRVIDTSPSRIGRAFLDIKIESYESLFSSITKIEDYIFVITSERENDMSIANYIRLFNYNAYCIFWQDL